jgi:methionyl-tRNA formyltransferase
VSLAPVPVHPRRLVFLGTPEVAVPPLRAIVAAGYDVALVVTRADKRRGRGGDLSPSPVKAAAVELGLPVTHAVDDALAVGADLGVVVAYGALIKPHVLAELPMVNIHFSLLPRWRGAAPVERAILAGDAETGVAIMQVEEGLDTGPVFAAERLAIAARETAAALRTRLVAAGTNLLVRTLADGFQHPQPQGGEPTYAAKIGPAELELDWSASALQLDRVIRVGDAWTTFRGRRLKVLEAHPTAEDDAPPLAPGELSGGRVGTGKGELVLVSVQPEGRGPQPMAAWRNGARPRPGEGFGR